MALKFDPKTGFSFGDAGGQNPTNPLSNFGSMLTGGSLKIDPNVVGQFFKNNPSIKPGSFGVPNKFGGVSPVPITAQDNNSQTSTPVTNPTTTQSNPVSIPNLNDTNQGLSSSQLSQMINEVLASQNKDPFNLQNQSPDFLNGLMGMITQGISKNNQNYLDVLNQARQANNIPQLQQQFADIGNLVNQQRASTQLGELQLGNQPIPQGLIQGQQALLEQQGQTRLQNLIGQQNVVGQQLGLAQGNIGQNLQAQQLQNQQTLGLAGLGVQAFSLPQQQALLQAQAQQAQAQAGFYQNLYGGLTGNQQGGFQNQGINPQFQSYTNGQALSQLPSYFQAATSQDINGTGYIVADRLPEAAKQFAGSIAGQLGVPILNSNQAQGVEKIDSSLGAINILQGLVNQTLGSGTGGRLADIAKSTLNDIFQNSPALTQLNRARTTAIQEIQGLAGDAPGLRLNSGEINAAAANLPTASDNIETALAKIQISQQMLENQRKALYNVAGGRNIGSNSGGNLQGGWSW